MKSDYHERKQRRIDRYTKLAAKNKSEASARFDHARKLIAHIPPGQPILVGHYSEKRHRAVLNRHDQNMRKGIEAEQKARHYERRAASTEDNHSISSDDPDAIAKLRDQLEKAEIKQAYMRNANKAIRAAYKHGVRTDGSDEDIQILVRALHKSTGHEHSSENARQLLERDFAGRLGFADYQLANNNANIRRIKQRIAQLEKLASATTVEYQIDNAKIVENVEENRLQIFFDDIPPADVRQRLKKAGFRWARSVGAWQRHLNNAARHAAKYAIKLTNT